MEYRLKKAICAVLAFLIPFMPFIRAECFAGIIGTAFSVTVPTEAVITMDEYGNTSASFPNIINRSTVSVAVTDVSVVSENGWTMTGFDSFSPANVKVDSDMFAIKLNGSVSLDDGTFSYDSGSWTRMTKNDASSDLDELPIECEIKISPVSTARSETICHVVFTVRK